MKLVSVRIMPDLWQLGLILTSILVSIIVGTACLVYDSAFSPLLVVGVILCVISALIWIKVPILALYTAVLVVFLPLGVFPSSIQSYLNRSLTIIALAVWFIYLVVQRRRIVWTGSGLIMLCFLVWCLITLFWAQNLEITKFLLGGYALRFVLFLFLIANEINSEKTLDVLMYTLAIAGWIYIIAGIITILSQGFEIGSRLQVLEENENTLGGLFPIAIIGMLWLVERLPRQLRALWLFTSFVFILLSFFLIALSGSRGSAITWLITMLSFLLWRETRLWGIVGLIIMVAAVIVSPLILSITMDRFLDRTNDSLLGGREALWRASLLLIRDHPLTGVGVGNSPQAMMSYIRTFRSVGGGDRAVIHNPILTIWVETGLPGLLLYLGVFAHSVWLFVRKYACYRKMDIKWLMPYFALISSALLGYLVSWIKGGGMELSFSYFLMLALLLIPSHLELKNRKIYH